MSAIMQESEAPGILTLVTGQPHPDFSEEYSRGELEEMSSFDLLDGYAQ